MRAPQCPKRGEARIDSGPRTLKLEIAGRDHVARGTRPNDLRALVRAQVSHVRILPLVVEDHEVAHLERAAGVRVHRAGDRRWIGGLVDGGVEAGPQIGGQFVHVVQCHRDLVRGDDVHVARRIRRDLNVIERDGPVVSELRRPADNARNPGVVHDLFGHRLRHHVGGFRAGDQIVHAVGRRAALHVNGEVLVELPGDHTELARASGHVRMGHRADHPRLRVEREHRRSAAQLSTPTR